MSSHKCSAQNYRSWDLIKFSTGSPVSLGTSLGKQWRSWYPPPSSNMMVIICPSLWSLTLSKWRVWERQRGPVVFTKMYYSCNTQVQGIHNWDSDRPTQNQLLQTGAKLNNSSTGTFSSKGKQGSGPWRGTILQRRGQPFLQLIPTQRALDFHFPGNLLVKSQKFA